MGAAGLELFFEGLEIGLAAGGRGVASVGDGVNEDVGDTGVFGGVGEGDEVVEVAVDTAVGHEAEEVEAGMAGLGEGVLKGRDGGELILADGLLDAGEVLVDDSAGAEVEVADLGVAHLSLGEADVFAAGGEGGLGVGLVEVLMEGGFCEQGGVAVGFGLREAAGINPPAITDDQNNGLGHSVLPMPSKGAALKAKTYGRRSFFGFGRGAAIGLERLAQARSPRITCPWTSVRRNWRPW